MAKTYPRLDADKRIAFGHRNKSLRRLGSMPANLYGKKIKSQSLTLDLNSFQKTYSQVGETGLVEIMLKGDKAPHSCLISDVHLDPVTSLPLHADFRQVDLTEKVTARVPVEIIGESPAVKEKGAVLITLLDEIEVEALPPDLPDKITVDISELKEFGDSLSAKDLKLERDKVSLKIADTEAIVMAQEPKKEEIITAPLPAPAEGETPPPAEGEGEPAKEEKSDSSAEAPAKTEEKSKK